MSDPMYGASQPQKKKPRGRPFQRGADPRRNSALPKVEPGATCPACNTGTMIERTGRFGSFLGCSRYPDCRHTQHVSSNGETQTGSDYPQGLADAKDTQQQQQQQQQAPQQAPQAGTLDAIVAQIARAAAAESVNETRVREIIDEVIDGIEWPEAAMPGSITVQVRDLPAVEMEGVAHKALKETLMLVSLGLNVYLVGPAGSGKTTLGRQVAAALGVKFATISCSPGLPESAFMGRMIPNLSDGTERYRSAPFVECYRNGGVFLCDEVDNADASTLLVLNAALANGHITLPDGTEVERHADFVFIVSANTYGHGQTREYVGRTQLDAAFLDRFAGATVEMDYDRDLETALCPDAELRNAVWAMRDKVRSLKLRRVVSTRAIINGHKLRAGGECELADVLQRLTRGWSPEDRTACGVKVC